MDFVRSAGVSAEKSTKVLQASAKLATGGLADLESTADAVTTVLNAYRMSAEKATRVTNVMFKTVELGKTTVPELAQQIGRVASTAAQAGISFEELSAAIAAMTAAGVRTEIAISSLGQLIQNLLNPNKALAEALQNLGYSSGLALLQARGLAGALDLLSKAIPREQLAEMIGSVEGLRAVMVLTGSQGDRFVEMIEKIKNSTGAADQAFKTISETASFKFRQALLSVQNALIELGAAFAPAFEKIAEAIRNTLDNLQKSGQIQQMQQDLKQLADDFGKALAGAIEKAAATMEKFNKLAPETRQKIIELAITLGPLTLAVGAVAGALSKIIDFVSKLGKGIAWLIEKIPQAAAAIAAFVSKIPPWLRAGGIFTAGLAGVGELGERIPEGKTTPLMNFCRLY
ncbi:MAG: phage tail tape measure protein [Armatimonadota bacterium]|nr:phage tail tape measure protein [Armatimonadota bacterium]